MKKTLNQKLRSIIMLALFLTATVSIGQVQYTIARGHSGFVTASDATGVTTSVTNILTTCSTSSPNNSSSSMTMTSQSGFSFYVTSVTGNRYRSSAGWASAYLNFINTNTSTNQSNSTTSITSSGTCGTAYSVGTFTYAASVQTVPSGQSATVSVIPSGSGSGYSGTKSITAVVTVTGIGTVTNSSNTAITSLSFPNTNVASTSAASSFVLQASAISGSNILIQAPTNWLVCETSNGTYTSSISFANNTATKTIYVKFAPTTAGSLSGQIVVSKETNGSGVANRTLNVSGTGVAVTPPAITSGLTDASVYGSTDSYQITASNTPNSFIATYNGGELPTGMSITTTTGLISINESLAAGIYNIAISASNAGGGAGAAQTLAYTRTAKPLALINGSADNKVYDGTTDATVVTSPVLSGIVNGDSVSMTGVPVAEFVSADAGIQQLRIAGGYTLDNTNYTLVYPQQPSGLTAEIFPKQLTIAGIFINDKNYDGNTVATIGGTPNLSGIVDGDVVTVNGSAAVASFSSANSGNNIPVTISGYVIEGTDATNYILLQPQGLTGNINDTGLLFQTITFDPLNAVTYGDTAFALNASSTSGLDITFTSSDENIALVSGNSVTIMSAGTVAITASQSGNTQYNPAEAVPQQLVINPKTLTITDAAIITKTYDGTTVAQVTGTLTGIVDADNVVTSGTGIFENRNVGENKVVTTLFTITGTDVENYTLQQPGDITGNITPLQLTLNGASAQDKIYDGTDVAVITGTLSGIIAPDVVSFVGNGTFENTNVAQNIAIDANLVLTGDDSGNYTIQQPAGLTADITQASITVEASVFDKVYDRTTDAEIVVTSVNGIVNGNDVIVTGGGVFNTYNAGTAKPVTSGLVLSGADAANYTLVQPTGLVASITKKDITADVTSALVIDKVYNNTTNATVSGIVLNDVISGDEADVEVLSAEFFQETVGNGIAVSGFVLSGTASGNYNLVQPTATITGNITPATLVLNSADAQDKVYDGTVAASIIGTLSGIITGDTVTYSGVGAFTSTDVANGIIVTAAISLNGADAANYVVTQPTGLSADIMPKAVTIAAEAVSKVYDGTTATTVQNAYINTGVISPDDVTLVENSVAGTFNSVTVANGKPVSATFMLAGADAANYVITAQTYPADITPATLTVDVTGAAVATKTYDGTDVAQVSGAVLSGLLEGDTVNAVGGTFDTPNAGTEKPVTIVLTGTGANNYTLIQPEPLLTGTINKKDITATANSLSKVQGTVNPALTITYNGLVNGETADTAYNFIAPITTTTAVTDSPIGVYPITLQGGSSVNYNFTSLTNGLLSVMATTTATNILAWDFTGEAQLATSTAEVQNSNLDSSLILSRGSGAAASAGANSFRTIGFQNNGIALNNTDYFQFEISADPNYVASLTSIDASFRGTSSFGNLVTHHYAYSTNGTDFTFIGNPVVTTAGEFATLSVDVSSITALQNIPAGTTITFRYYASGNTSTGGWGYYSASSGSYGLAIKGFVSVAPVLPVITSVLTDSSFIGDVDTYQITASGTPQIDFSATSLPTGASINSSGIISFDGTTPAGIYNITLSASSVYGTDTKTLVYTVNKLNQILTFHPDPIPVKMVGDAPFLFEVNNTAGLLVNWSSSDESVVTIDTDGIITIIGEGTAVIAASNSGNDIYNGVIETRIISVSSGCFEWTGAVGSIWNDSGNWCGGVVPTAASDITIPATANNPVIASGVAYAHNLTLGAGAT
ncbi:beta strand repeat-containing protein, partial [Flavobacterium sp. RHBU_3]|uniref:beta strand repeat-containing protein n=1 Tax=Flavobacterium sp. RHBU_3 TaxID=3391184 RepID=UPI003984FF86